MLEPPLELLDRRVVDAPDPGQAVELEVHLRMGQVGRADQLSRRVGIGKAQPILGLPSRGTVGGADERAQERRWRRQLDLDAGFTGVGKTRDQR